VAWDEPQVSVGGLLGSNFGNRTMRRDKVQGKGIGSRRSRRSRKKREEREEDGGHERTTSIKSRKTS
jgi:hypothetical protein